MKASSIAVLVVLTASIAFRGMAAETVNIGFEQSEGFPAAKPWPSKVFAGMSVPAGVVATWKSNAIGLLRASDGTFEVTNPAPVAGAQFAVCGFGGAGVVELTLVLEDSANLGLIEFYWAWRGNGDARVGGSAFLEAEYFDRNGSSVGKDRFQGGLNPDQSPKFTRAKPSLQGGALSKIIFRGVCPNPDQGHGTFFLDEIRLAVRPDPTAPFSPVPDKPVSRFISSDTTPPVANGAMPPPDSTTTATGEIGARFADVGSGIKVASAKILLDGRDVSREARITAQGFKFRPARPLDKGIHRVEVFVSDEAGNPSNRLVWRFAVGEVVPVRASFEKDVFVM